MKHTVTKPSETKATLEVSLDAKDLAPIKTKALQSLAGRAKVPGFRPGKLPLEVASRHLDPTVVQQHVVEEAVNKYYLQAIMAAQLQPLERPEVSVTKFVPDQELTFSAQFEIVPEVKLADYTKIKKPQPKISIKAAEITEVIERLRQQLGEKKEVTRAAKDGDELIIDFAGRDAKDQPIKGASGTAYPLRLGSKTFIDGFEENLIGQKAGDEKEFTLTFPKDYGHTLLANKKVTFKVTVKKVHEIALPKVDDAFAKKVGPFETVEELKKDIKKEITDQQETTNRNHLKNEIVETLIEKSKVPLPKTLVADQERMVRQDALQNLAYRGMTLKDYLTNEKLTEDEWVKKEVMPAAEKRVATGLVLSEVAKKEKIVANDDEVKSQTASLKQQMQDPKMRSQIDTPEAQRDIASRLVTEKTLDHLIKVATAAK